MHSGEHFLIVYVRVKCRGKSPTSGAEMHYNDSPCWKVRNPMQKLSSYAHSCCVCEYFVLCVMCVHVWFITRIAHTLKCTKDSVTHYTVISCTQYLGELEMQTERPVWSGLHCSRRRCRVVVVVILLNEFGHGSFAPARAQSPQNWSAVQSNS